MSTRHAHHHCSGRSAPHAPNHLRSHRRGIVGLSTFAIAGPATAATPVGDVVYYGAADFGTETGSGYPASGDWFYGQVNPASYPGGNGAVTFTSTGLNIATGPDQALQILNQDVLQPTDATNFLDLVDTVGAHASNDDWTYQIAVFGEPGQPDQQFTTLRPAVPGNGGIGGDWITSRALPGYAAGASAPLVDLVNALYTGVAPQVLATGFFITPNTTVSLYVVGGFGTTSAFLPVAQRTISPATPESATTPGVRFQASGFTPNSSVEILIYDCDTDEELGYLDGTNADAAGNVDVTVPFDATPAVGTYCAAFHDGFPLYTDGALPDMQFSIAVPAPELAATGAESTQLVALSLAGASLLLLGVGAAVLAARKRRGVEAR